MKIRSSRRVTNIPLSCCQPVKQTVSAEQFFSSRKINGERFGKKNESPDYKTLL